MPSKPERDSSGRAHGLVAERRIYIRTAKKTRFLVVSPAAQIGGFMLGAALIGWTGFVTSAFVKNALDGRASAIQIETLTEAYEARLAAYEKRQAGLEEELNLADQRRDEVTVRLSEKQARLVETANGLREATGELEVLRAEFQGLITRQRNEQTRMAALEADLADLRASLAQAKIAKSNIDVSLQGLTGAIAQVIAERDRAAGVLVERDADLARKTADIAHYEDRQERLISQLEAAAKVSLAGLETLFGRTPVDLDAILAQARRDYGGAGGPFEPLDDLTDDAERHGDNAFAEGDMRVAALMEELEAVSLMRFAAERIPLGNPVPSARHTSGFGPRRDPRGRGRAIHNGYDLAAPKGTPIYVTADGVVIFAGRQRGYGNLVKVRHAFGFETVYAHNSRIRVKVGQRVSRGDRIADVGNTGRSTGSHLHYEIRIDKRPVNPRKFIEAPRNVL